ncbi:MAG: SufD family Fe-S cluster assembly protein, partial [Ruminococcus sp.]|nr:SufD family Fe-S cluster assembly protein [Ruminococcus sp.]
LTEGEQNANAELSVSLDGDGSSCDLISRGVAKEHSVQKVTIKIDGNAECHGHAECDSIIMDHGVIAATPMLTATNVDASLIHEAAIGKIAGEQLTKLMTMGLDEKEAEELIIRGFLR